MGMGDDMPEDFEDSDDEGNDVLFYGHRIAFLLFSNCLDDELYDPVLHMRFLQRQSMLFSETFVVIFMQNLPVGCCFTHE